MSASLLIAFSRRVLCGLPIAGLALLSVSCRTISPHPGDSALMPIYYATDRKPLLSLPAWRAAEHNRNSEFAYYGGSYDPSHLELGRCDVSLPMKQHHTGVIERPGWLAADTHPEKYFEIQTLQPMALSNFFAGLANGCCNSSCHDVFVFIHGYNVPFAAAAMYTSQLAWDWRFQGIPVLYSWPSNGTLLGYPKDEESARLTERHLNWFLHELLSLSGATNVHLIAHSLGCRALTEVLRTWTPQTNRPPFGQIILAAPDVNQVGFMQDVAEVLPKLAKRITVYASSSDKALPASRSFHQFPRVGDAENAPFTCEGLDTIDTSGVSTDLLGHSYMMNSPAVISDMADVLCRSLAPAQRKLTRSERKGHVVWKLSD